MYKLYLSCLFFIMCIPFTYAHDSDIAYFDITTEGTQTIIHAEFSWSIRNALIAFDSNYNNAKTIEDINDIFLRYTKEKLKIFDTKDKQLHLLKVVLEKNNEEHNHATRYTLIFEGSDISKVSNTMMFEQNNSQKNYHWYLNKDGKKEEAITDNTTSSFNITTETSSYLKYYLIIGAILLLGLLIFSFKRKTAY
ncbi:hypothetical protein [Winogradskyella sp. Asnod2-B02-A]|uniref:hypothetical protein n=1 Tax=Winogradskyella sp. Asnod2-B02-A TaxID=3160583 RepID=UPI003863DA8F